VRRRNTTDERGKIIENYIKKGAGTHLKWKKPDFNCLPEGRPQECEKMESAYAKRASYLGCLKRLKYAAKKLRGF
jgi:hypothetical protein